MPDQDTVRIEWHGKVGTVPRARLPVYLKDGALLLDTAPAKAPPKVEEENFLKKASRGAALGGFAGAGIAETEHPIRDTLAGLKKQVADMFAPDIHPFSAEAWKKSALANPAVAVPRALAGEASELGQDIGFKRVGRFAAWEKPKNFDVEKTSHDLSALITSLLLLRGGREAAETPIKEGAVAKAGGSAVRNLLDVSERDLAEAKQKVEVPAKKEFAEAKGEELRAKKEQSKIEGQRRSFEDAQERYAKEGAENIDKAERMEKLSLDSEWQDFRAKVLGVSKEAPNGTLQSRLTPVGEAVLKAKETIVKGSDTNIPIFKDLMGRFSEMVDTPEGPVPLENQMIPTDQLRGYIRELDDKIYGSDLPSDVRNAMKHVSEVANKEVEASIEDVHGKAAKRAYENLKDRYSDYMETWNDKSSGSPLVKIKSLLREPISTRRGVPVYREVADILRGKDGEKILATLGRKRKFGADTSTIAKLRSAAAKLKELPQAKEVPSVERVIERFDPEKFVRDTVEGKAKTIERWGVTGALIYGLRDMVLHQKVPWQSMLGIPVIGKLLKRGMTNPKFIQWLVEGATKGGTV